MSLKRKAAGNPSDDAPKRPKADFFSPRKKHSPQASSSSSFQFKSKASGACVRLTTWNVNGIMSLDEKILRRYLKAEDPDILILTETKYSKEGRPDIMSLKTGFKYHCWGQDPRSAYAGTAILSKIKPLDAIIGLPSWKRQSTGRYVELEFDDVFVVGTYAPNAGTDFKNLEVKHQWNVALKERLEELGRKKPIIWGGDFNCIMSKQDLDSTAGKYWNQMASLLAEERSAMNKILCPDASDQPVLVDVWREKHPTEEEYTHSSTRYGSWRLDSFIISASLMDKVDSCEIRHELKDLKLSDHWPVTLDIRVDINRTPPSSGSQSDL